MSTLKQNPLANLIKAAVGFSATNSSCCGFPSAVAAAVTSPSDSRPDSAESVETKAAGSCGCSGPTAAVPAAQDTSTSDAACQCGN